MPHLMIVPEIVPVVVKVRPKLLGFLTVLLQLGFIGRDLSFAGAGRLIRGELGFVLFDLLLGCLQLLLVLLDFGFVGLSVLLQSALIAAAGWRR